MVQLIGIGGVATVGLFGFLASALKLPQTAKVQKVYHTQATGVGCSSLFNLVPELRRYTSIWPNIHHIFCSI